MFFWGLILIVLVNIGPSSTKCSQIPTGLYCTNLVEGTDNKTLTIQSDDDEPTTDVQFVYLRNSTGGINNKTFSNFTKLKSLDIQFSHIDKFSLNINTVNSIYLMHNSKFPALSAELMEDCCKTVSILFLVGNNDLKIETGAFKHMTNLTHLTISKQNITSLTKQFFDGLNKLTYLNLKLNGILKINENAFEDLAELNHLILSYNNFTKLEAKTFHNLKLLEAMELQGLNFSEFDLNIFSSQKELKTLELPTKLIGKLELEQLVKAFPKLETFGFSNEEKEGNTTTFIEKCKASGYNIKFSNSYDL
ncbi:hypothetical protein NQ315_017171 [Exocentrus adspersus]|uniref:Uncharacterized protein n=1 Tax=Exocentrus adspersus TaxID=1586481 RepID=A0AAV8VGJ8_9CUCU|nr:hypothetical protein NQ315_017171 [Exocentrus adspersus]